MADPPLDTATAEEERSNPQTILSSSQATSATYRIHMLLVLVISLFILSMLLGTNARDSTEELSRRSDLHYLCELKFELVIRSPFLLLHRTSHPQGEEIR